MTTRVNQLNGLKGLQTDQLHDRLFLFKNDIKFVEEMLPRLKGWLFPEAAYMTCHLVRSQTSSGVRGPGLEIGVYEGRFLSLLVRLLRERSDATVGIDTFQFIPLENVKAALDGVLEDSQIGLSFQVRDSATLQPEELYSWMQGRPVVISVDGDHSAAAVARDLALCDAVLGDGGIVIVDDFMNHFAVGVTEGVYAYLSMKSRGLVPCVFIGQKLFFCRAADAERYRAAAFEFGLHGQFPACETFRAYYNRDSVYVQPEISGHTVLMFPSFHCDATCAPHANSPGASRSFHHFVEGKCAMNTLSFIKRSLRKFLQHNSDQESVKIPATPAEANNIPLEPPETVAFRAASTVRALERITSRNVEIRTVIDIGASNGMWSAAALPLLPDAKYILVEAQRGHVEALKDFVNRHPNAEYVLAAAGDKEGEIFFDDSDLFGGVACKERTESARLRVPMVTVDSEIARRGLSGPYLVKLDTHGFEVPILKGAEKTLRSTNLVIIETYNFRITHDSLLFYEMCAYMEKLGFGVIDISEPLWRTYDRSFWQIDIFFVPLTRPEFSHLSYA